MIQQKVIEIPLSIPDKDRIIVEASRSYILLNYNKPKARQVVVAGDYNDMPEVMQGGLKKVSHTPEGVLYSSEDNAPGYQIESGMFVDYATQNLFTRAFNTVKKEHETVTGDFRLPGYQHSWFFISPPTNDEAAFHEHSRFNDTFPHDVPLYTWVYYLQLPNNCQGDEGMLTFKEGDETFSMDVNLDTLYVFPANLLHRPNLAPESTETRITAAGNILLIGASKSMISE